MKKIVSVLALAAVVSVSAHAQSILGSLGNVLSNAANVVYSAPVSLNGTYSYGGSAVSVSSSEGGVITNLAGTAVTSGIEAKADQYLAKVGIQPGFAQFTFNASDNSFVMNIGKMSLPGTYKVHDGEKTVTLTFGKALQFFTVTGTLESHSNGAKILFTANNGMEFFKKIAAKMSQSSSQISGIAKLADGYDNYRIGFKLSK